MTRFADMAVDEYTDALEEATTISQHANLLAEVRFLIGKLRDLDALIVSELLPLMDAKTVDVPGVGLLEAKRQRTKVQWDSDALRRVVQQRALLSPNGEVLHVSPIDAGHAVGDAFAQVLGMTASTGWRVGGLVALGIDPDEYRSSDWGDTKVTITEGES